MSEPLLSVIVPIYNVETYLEKCIDSILHQIYTNVEIILIDDGSTDKSGNICDEYMRRDARIRVYHQKNHGLVLSRKKGLELATGELVTFVDSDDWIEEEMYASMVSVYSRENADMVSSGLYYDCSIEHKTVGHELDLLDEGCYSNEELKKRVFPIMMWNDKYARRGVVSSVCNKIYRKEILEEVLLGIDDRITLGEDAAITYLYIARANKIAVINKCWYHYVHRKKSMVRNMGFVSFEKIYILQECLYREFKKLNMLDVMNYQIERYICTFLRGAIASIYAIDMERVCFVFPYELVPKKSKIILYGAGRVGKSYWNCIRHSEYLELVAWVDRNYGMNIAGQILIENPKLVNEREFDYVLISVVSEKVAKEIKGELIQLGVQSEKILWKQPQVIL